MYYENVNNSEADFLTHLDTITQANGWTILDNTNNRRVYEGNGVIVLFEKETSSDEDYINSNYKRFNINILESGNYVQGSSIYNQVTGFEPDFVISTNPCFLYQSNAKSKTFISVNENRILFVLSQNNQYQSFYAGKILQYGSPAQYPNPHIYMGCTSRYSFNINSETNRLAGSVMGSELDSSAKMYVKRWDNKWLRIDNSNTLDGSYACVYPFVENTGDDFTTNIDGSYTAIPTLVISENSNYDSSYYTNTGGYILGEMEGLFCISSFENSPENTFIYDAQEYICFPGRYQSSEFAHYFAIKKA